MKARFGYPSPCLLPRPGTHRASTMRRATKKCPKGWYPVTPEPSSLPASLREPHTDLVAAWDWEFDAEFLSILSEECARAGIRFRSVARDDIVTLADGLKSRAMTLGVFLDRTAPDEEPHQKLLAAVLESGAQIVNHPDQVRRAADKATMHLELLTKGIDVPYTIIVSPYSERKEIHLSLTELSRLGRPFIIKPANTTGGGTGVIMGAETLKEVIESRQHHKRDKYLLQERIVPAAVEGKRAWFRVFHVCGLIIPCWWDDLTHIYTAFEEGQMDRCGLKPLLTITKAIAEVCRLDFFSTEIALAESGRFTPVDYVNEICDMRVQSIHADGVPDGAVRMICARLAAFAALHAHG